MAPIDLSMSVTSYPNVPRAVPPLQQGDRLGRIEFFKRYALMPEGVKAERIEGIVHIHPERVSAGFHGNQHAQMGAWLGWYYASTPGVAAADNSTTMLDIDNDAQPDVSMFVLPSHAGRIKMTPEGFIDGAPELIVEIAASRISFELGAKFNTYRRNGVQEYIVHRTYDGEIDWFVLRDGQYEKQSPDAEGICRSEVFPGLWLNIPAALQGKLAEVLVVLQRGTATPEHKAFVKKREGQSSKRNA